MSKSPGDRLKAAREAAGYKSASAFATKFDFTDSAYRHHENGTRDLSVPVAKQYAAKLGIPWESLFDDAQKGRSVAKLSLVPKAESGEFTQIGRFDASFSMGPGSLVADHPEPMGFWALETQWLRGLSRATPDNLAIVKADGDSMVPTLANGDWVLVDRSQTRLTREGIYAIRVGDDVWVKRLSINLRDKTVRVISDNTVIPVQDIQESDLSIIGRVIALVARRLG